MEHESRGASPPPLVHRREQAVEGLAEERDAVLEQPVGHVVEGDADALERRRSSRRASSMLSSRLARSRP